MFCPNCANQLPDGSTFCTSCGANLKNDNVPTENPALAVRMKKGAYLKSELASKKAKLLSKIVLAVFVVASLVLGFSINNVINGAFHKIPLITFAMDEGDTEEFESNLEEIREQAEKAREIFEENEDKISEDSAKTIKKALDTTEKFAEKPSISNMQAFIGEFSELEDLHAEDLEKAGLSNQIDVKGFSKEVESASKLFDTIKIASIIVGAAIILLALLSALFKINCLSVLALILSLPVTAISGGKVYVILSCVCFLVLIVMISIINREYKKYKKSLRK